ncbi:pre-mRNA splicing regulator USH1G [Planococcus citri]|uniref:pre-mRNA splicing regulator USH1G n=1 Tax=Planococcus citri TaxID=170843 RepID=UPI0031F8DE5C
MTTTRFHKAAKDGLLDILKEASKKDCNSKDEDGMTPTLWAAYEGNLDTLRLLVGRGGDPEKANYHFGQNALHIAASKGHMNCVSFLVAFDVNLWALDHDFHTAIDLAAMNGRYEVLQFLDNATAKLEANNKKKADLRKEKAQKDAERRLKKYEERSKKDRDKQKKQFKKFEKDCDHVKNENDTVTRTGDCVKKLYHDTNGQCFTQIVSNGTISSTKKTSTSTGIKKMIDRKLKNGNQSNNRLVPSESCIIGIVDDTSIKSVRSLFEHSQNHKNNLFNDYCTTAKRGRIKDLFDIKTKLHRSTSQPDLIHKLHFEEKDYEAVKSVHSGDSGSLFDRPGFGSVAFRQTVPVVLSNLPHVSTIRQDPQEDSQKDECSIGSAGSLAKRILPSHATAAWDTNSNSIHTSDEENAADTTNTFQLPVFVHQFLLAVGVAEYEPEFVKQRVDMEALFMLNDQDLVSLGIPLGPRRKLLNAIKDYKHQSQRCKEMFERSC